VSRDSFQKTIDEMIWLCMMVLLLLMMRITSKKKVLIQQGLVRQMFENTLQGLVSLMGEKNVNVMVVELFIHVGLAPVT